MGKRPTYEYSLCIPYPEKLTAAQTIRWMRETANRIESFTEFVKTYNEPISVKFEDFIIVDNFVEEENGKS